MSCVCAQFGLILAIIIHILWHETISTFLDAGMQRAREKEKEEEREREFTLQFSEIIIVTTEMACMNVYT